MPNFILYNCPSLERASYSSQMEPSSRTRFQASKTLIVSSSTLVMFSFHVPSSLIKRFELATQLPHFNFHPSIFLKVISHIT